MEQIRKIAEGLGNDPVNSYVCRALEGVLEDAETNIEWDAAFSMKQRCETAEENAKKFHAENEKLMKQIAELKQELQEANEDAQEWQKQYDRIRDKANEYANSAKEHWNNFREQEDKVEALEMEIVKLKAKLYDMMMGAA